MSLLVIGTVALDTIRTSSGVKKNLLGGSATHFSMSARIFAPVHLVSTIGRDFPKKYIRFLSSKGIDTSSLIEGRGKTFRWEGEYQEQDFNTALTLVTEVGVLMSYVPEIAQHQKNIKNVFLANIDPDIQFGLLKLMNKPHLVGLDSMNLWITHKKKRLIQLLKQVHLFVVNDMEARTLTGENNLIKAARAIRKMGARFVVIKKGEHGVLFFCDKFMFSFPAYPVESVVDPTGAGDTFAGGLMGYLSKVKKINEKKLRRAVIYATTVASFNVQGFGLNKTSTLTMAIINQRRKLFEKFMAVV